MRSKTLCLAVSKPEKWLAAQSAAHAFRHQQSKQAFVKENEKNVSVWKKSVKSMRLLSVIKSVKAFPTQPVFTCSKLTIETLGQGAIGVVLVSLLLTLNIFHILF